MNFQEAIISCTKKYASITGRATRSEYWFFQLFYFLILTSSAMIGALLFGKDGNLFQGLFSLALLTPSFCVSVRRLHDINKSGWWILLQFIPIIGWIIILVWHCTKSDDESNKYGDSPLVRDIP